MTVSPSRRHASARAAQRRWEDVSEWPFQFVVLPVLVAFAFCLVLFLGSKHGTRLAAFRTWFHLPCRTGKCTRAMTVDLEGGLVASAGGSSGGGGLSGISGILRLDTTTRAVVGGAAGGAVAVSDFGVMTLAPEDKLKYDFNYWLAKGEKLVGQQSKDCDVNYGMQYIDKWRKTRVDWCVPPPANDPALLAATAAATARRQLRDSGGNAKTSASSAEPGAAKSASSNSAAAASSSSSSPASQSTAAAAAAAAAAGGDGLPLSSLVYSSISLYPYHDKDANLNFLVANNTVLDSRSFLGSLAGGLPEPRSGSYAASCRLGAGAGSGGSAGGEGQGSKSSGPPLLPGLPGEEFMVELEGIRKWTRDALHTEAYGKVSQACTAKTVNSTGGESQSLSGPVEHPVLLLSRTDPTNAFRTVEEAVFAFTTLAVLKDPDIATKGIQVVIADGKPDGFYLDLWAALSRPYPLRLLSQQHYPPNTCLSRAVHSTYGGSSILTSMGVARRTTCRSSVAMAASLWVRHLLSAALQSPLQSAFGAQQQNKGVVRKSVVWISRRNFEGLAQTNLTSWQQQRRFENEGEVVLELQREIWRWNDEACLRSGLTKSFGSSHHHHHHHHQHHRSLLTPKRRMQLRHLMSLFQMKDRKEEGKTATATTATTAAVVAGATAAEGDLVARQRIIMQEWVEEENENLLSHQDQKHQNHQLQLQQKELHLLSGEGGVPGGSSSSSSTQPWWWRRRQLRGSSSSSHRCRASSVFFDLRVVELNDIPFYPDHVQVLGQASVLVGAHGSGLANMIWMSPGKGGVLELHHNSAGNDHYHNLAHLLGHKYLNVDSDGDRVDLGAVAEGLRKLLDAQGAAA